jgi:hypothetical protein
VACRPLRISSVILNPGFRSTLSRVPHLGFCCPRLRLGAIVMKPLSVPMLHATSRLKFSEIHFLVYQPFEFTANTLLQKLTYQ